MFFLSRITAILIWLSICLCSQIPRHIRRQEGSVTVEGATPPTPTTCGDIIDDVNRGRVSPFDLFDCIKPDKIHGITGFNLFFASEVLECLVSVPFNQAVALRFIDYYNTTMQFQSTLSYLRNPPSNYQQPTIDFVQHLEDIKANVESGFYRNQYAFEADVQHLVQSLHDAHVYLVGGALAAFSFGSDSPLMTLSVDGVKTPEIYFKYDVQNRLQYNISSITKINGEEVVEYLSRFAALNVYGSLEPHGDWNQIMYSPVQDVLDIYDVFSMNTPFAWGDSLEFTMGNNSVVEASWVALYTNSDFTGPLTTGGDYYNYFVLGLIPASYDEVPLPCPWVSEPTDRCPEIVAGNSEPVEITSWFNETNGAFPSDPVVAQPRLSYGDGGGTVTGYILDEKSVGVLSIPSFAAFGWDIGNFSDAVGNFIRAAQDKHVAKIVIDLQGNTGGLVELAFVTFNHFFPQIYPFARSRRRSHELADILGTSLTEYWNSLPLNSDEKVDKFEANEWVITDRLNAQTRQNFSSWAEYFGPRFENGDNFSFVEQYDLANKVFDSAAFEEWVPGNYLDGNFNPSALPPWIPEDVVMLTDGACSSACTLFVEMMSQQAGVRTVVVGGRPEPGPMQAAGGSRGALAYSASDLDEDFAASSGLAPHGVLPILDPETSQRDSGIYLITAGFNLRDQVRSPDPGGPPLQFSYEAADCRLYWTLDNALNMTRLWYDAAGAIWGLGLNASCVPGSTGYASHGVHATATAAAPQNTATGVPSLPALEWNGDALPGDSEDVGLEDWREPEDRRRPAGKNPPPCSTTGAVAPDRKQCVSVTYVCDNGGRVDTVVGLQPCMSGPGSDTRCGASYFCSTTDDHPFESSQQSRLGQGITEARVKRSRGFCYPTQSEAC